MARPTKPRIPRRKSADNPDGTLLASPPSGEENEASAGSIFDSTQDSEGYVKVYRRDDIDKQLVFHGRFAVEEATTDRVAEFFGGGSYRAQLFERDGRGSFVIVKTVSFKLPGYYKPPKETPLHGTQKQDKPASTEVGHHGTVNANDALNTALVSQVIDMLKAVRQPQPNPLMDLLPSIIGILPELMKRKDDVSPAITAMLQQQQEEMRELRRALEAAQNRPSGPATDVIAVARQMAELREVFGAGSDSTPDPESMMWAAGLKALEVLGQGKGATTPTPTSTPGTAPAMLTDGNVPMWRKLLASQRKAMLTAAAFGIDPEAAAEVAIKRMPPHLHGVIVEFLRKPDHVEIAMQEIPELREFTQWTTDFFAVAADMVLEDVQEETETPEDADDSTGG